MKPPKFFFILLNHSGKREKVTFLVKQRKKNPLAEAHGRTEFEKFGGVVSSRPGVSGSFRPVASVRAFFCADSVSGQFVWVNVWKSGGGTVYG